MPFIGNGQYIQYNIRSLDNNQAIASDTTEMKLYRAIKEIPLSREKDGVTVSIGGEVRQQVRFFNHINFGDVPAGISDRDTYWLQRYLVHADLNLGRNFRFFTQLNSTAAVGKQTKSNIDNDYLSVMQAFLDIKFSTAPQILLRIGRQDINYGSGMFIGTRNGPNNRQPFDGILSSISFQHIRADLFVLSPVRIRESLFDNEINKDVMVVGTYLTWDNNDRFIKDIYYFGTRYANNISQDDTLVSEWRHSTGIRLSNRNSNLAYTTEFIMQFGNSGASTVHAWILMAELSYRLNNLAMQPVVGLRQVISSGDTDPEDTRNVAIRTVSGRPPVNYMVPIGPVNIVVTSPGVRLSFSQFLDMQLNYYAVWRYSERDGIYSPASYPLIREGYYPGMEYSRYYCQGFSGELIFQRNQHFNCSLTGGMFLPGAFLKDTGAGKRIEVLVLRGTYWF